MKISNPVLTGFHADPSMIRVGDTYYIANSTFEWFPGVRLHESKDLVHWNILPSPLSRSSQLDMRGNPSSGGIWAPDLSYADGRFWLIYTDVKVVNGAFKDCTNYLVTAEDIHGPWSEPVRINGVGFDASLFHDDDGRKYFAHTLNNTCVAPPRMLIAFLENNLQADGRIRIPEALRMYMGGKEYIG